MTHSAPMPTFRTSRLVTPATDPAQRVMISPDPALCDIVRRALQGDALGAVDVLPLSLCDVVRAGAEGVRHYATVLFEASPDDVAEMAALRLLTAFADTGTRFLAVTAAPLSQAATARLIDAGVQDVLSLGAAPADPAAAPVQARAEPGRTAHPADQPGRMGRSAQKPAAVQTGTGPQTCAAPSGPSHPAAQSGPAHPAAPLASAVPSALPEPPSHPAPGATTASPGQRGAIIAVTRARGGVGATTVAVNLATELARTAGHRVLLLDFDLQHGDAAFYLDVEDQGALAGMIRSGTTPDSTFLRTAVTDHASGLHILPAPAELAPLQAVSTAMVAGLLDAVQRDYDHIVIDLPQAVVDWIQPILERAAMVLVVTDTSVPAIRQAHRLIAAYCEDLPALPVEIVVSGEAKPYLATTAHKAAARVLDRPLGHWIARDAVAARRAIDRGAPLADVAPRSRATKALRALAAHVAAGCAAARNSA